MVSRVKVVATQPPLGAVLVATEDSVKQALRVRQLSYGGDAGNTDHYKQVDAYWESGDSLYVPRQFARDRLGTVVNGVVGSRTTFSGASIKHTGQYAYQEQFVRQIVDAASEYGDFLVEAATGKGKTVCALSAIARIGRVALIVVDQENLLEQWVGAISKFLGVNVDDIGHVQGKICRWEGCSITVAMVQTLVSRRYDDDFYRNFGVVVFDEVHSVGAPTFSKVLMMFPAKVRFGVSATVARRDAFGKLLAWNLGGVRARLLDKHDRSYVYYVESDSVFSWYANISPKAGRILSEIAEDTSRNLLLAHVIRWLYDSGRDVLVLGDRIEQLECLQRMCYYDGIPQDDLGLYTGYRNVYQYRKEAVPKRIPSWVQAGAPYTPVEFVKVQKRVSAKDLKLIADSARVIFATYGKAAKGLDIPRLSSGLDCTPRFRAEQAHGRILRAVDGKPTPIWVTVRDVHSYRLEYTFANRLSEYVKSNTEVYEWNLTKGVRLVDVKALQASARRRVEELKQQEIRMSSDGNNTLVTQPTLRK